MDVHIGDRVRVNATHSHRGGHRGTVVEPDVDGALTLGEKAMANRYCIRFDTLGAGINGKYLFLDERDFTIE